jgi:hexosaminidase
MVHSESIGSKLIVEVEKKSDVKLGMDETYHITIKSDSIMIKSQTDIGAIRAFETLLQLLSADEKGYYFPNIDIVDSPRFPWRGLMIDVCRHFMPVDVIKRNIDGMAAVKMNVLHLHLSEDQGFRVESKTYPKLHELASNGNFFTHEQIKEIIKYADDRGIRVVPEFDVPGHATAILTAYPELASAPGPYSLERSWGIFDPTLNPILDTTYIFLDNLFAEMAQLFNDEYFHIGGDENNGKQWDSNKEIQAFKIQNDLKDNHALQGYFNQKILEILTKHGKIMVGWDEILHPSMPKNIVIQSWRGKEALIKAAKDGYQTILSNGYYIDLIQPTDFHYLNDPISPDTNLSETEKEKILGGEATMWAELVSPENVDSRIWPRTAAIAERLWSPSEINDVEFMYKRLDEISYQLEEHGLMHIKNYDMILRRLTNNNKTESLDILISVLEPVKKYKRHGLKKHTQQSPLTRVVDASTPDSKEARKFRSLVNDFLSDTDFDIHKVEKIKKKLVMWRDNHKELIKTIVKSPILFEIEPMSKNLERISNVGLEIIDYLYQNKTPNNTWVAETAKIIENSKEPIAQTELMIVESIEKLFNKLLNN